MLEDELKSSNSRLVKSLLIMWQFGSIELRITERWKQIRKHSVWHAGKWHGATKVSRPTRQPRDVLSQYSIQFGGW